MMLKGSKRESSQKHFFFAQKRVILFDIIFWKGNLYLAFSFAFALIPNWEISNFEILLLPMLTALCFYYSENLG